MNKCIECWKVSKIKKVYHPTNFTWSKDPNPTIFIYCSKECIKKANKTQQEAIIPLAYLDKAINYCQYFTRTKGNEWIYDNGTIKQKISWLADYKSHSLPYRLHDRYKGKAPEYMFAIKD